MITERAIVVAAGHVRASDLNDEKVILDLNRNLYHMLNSVGSRIWDLIQRPTEVSNVRDQLLSEYKLEADPCLAELKEFFEKLSREGLLEIR